MVAKITAPIAALCWKGKLDGMKNPTQNASGLKNSEAEIFRKHGAQVTDMAERGIQAIGVLGGVRTQDQEPGKDPSPANPSGTET